jgi:hypothetical protein
MSQINRRRVERQAEDAARALTHVLPAGVGFAVVVFDEEGYFASSMNSDVDTVRGTLRALLSQWEEIVAGGHYGDDGDGRGGPSA